MIGKSDQRSVGARATIGSPVSMPPPIWSFFPGDTGLMSGSVFAKLAGESSAAYVGAEPRKSVAGETSFLAAQSTAPGKWRNSSDGFARVPRGSQIVK